MRKIIVFAAMAICLMADHGYAAMDSYCQTPPFISTVAAPNVLLMIDTSGSMGWDSYSYNDTDTAPADGKLDHYDATKVYEGYFNPVKKYSLDGNGVYQEEVGSTCSKKCGAADDAWTCPSNTTSCYYSEAKGTHGCNSNRYACCTSANLIAVNCGELDTGNYLNYKYMARIDLLRWAMTGGKPDGCAGTIAKCDPGTSYPNAQLTACDATGCTMVTAAGIKVKVPWVRITGDDGGLLYQFKNLPVQPRMGSMYFGNNGVNQTVLIGDFTSAANVDAVNPYKETITALNSQSPSGSTPIGPALWAAYAYFGQYEPVFGGPTPDHSAEGNPFKNPMYQCIDGVLNGVPDGNCQGNEFVPVPCAKNFMILLTDGQWNRGGAPGSVTSTCTINTGYNAASPPIADSSYASADPVVPAYWLHKKGFTNQATNPQITSNVESLYGVGLWLGGTGATSLKNVTMYGSFDTSKTWPSNTTGYPQSTCTVDDCGAGKGSPCTALPPSSSDWDKNGNNIPDTFFGASDALEIKEKIKAIIDEIMRKASSGTAVSVLSSSEGSGANLLQALFYPKRSFANNTEVDWSSDLMSYWYYMDPFFKYSQIREDTAREGAAYTLLDLTQDYITNFAFDPGQNKTLAHRWWDTTGTSTVVTDMGTVPIESTIPIWRAGFNLWWTAPADRTIKTSVDGANLMSFDTANYATLDDYLGQTAVAADAKATINYVRGYDCVDAAGAACVCGTANCNKIGRDRTVTNGVCSARRSPCNDLTNSTDCPSGETCIEETHVWKLGDIISSTPRIMGPAYLNNFNLPAPFGYNDQTYKDFITSNDYKNRQLAFVGANDGMLHAFKLGKLLQNWTGKHWYEAAKQEGDTGAGGIGSESYAFIPKNALPYLQYLHDTDYCHIYMVDGPIAITEASINKPSTCTLTDYWDCPKLTTMQKVCSTSTTTACAVNTDCPSGETCVNSGDVDFTKTSWRTTLIGSMGIGGATCNGAAADADRISTPFSVSGNPVGWSSYFALDVTDQATPQLLWEFSNADLGVTNIGPAIVKVGGNEKRCTNDNATCSADVDCDAGIQCVNTNGRWFAILASGSTGPIATKEFKGTSDKSLKLFVLDLKTGALLRTIDTGAAPTNLGLTNTFAGSISTSVIDLEKDRASNSGNYQDDAVYIGYVKDTTNGGVLRLVINDDINPANWTVSKVIENIGPVTTSVVNLLDRRNQKLWLYFAEGRFFYKKDDPTTQRKLFGIQEPCFDPASNSISPSCTSTLVLATDLVNQTAAPSATLTSAQKGWYINMNAAASSISAERVISNPTPDPLGAIYFLSFAPTADICNFGGTTYLWALDYKTGGKVAFAMQGKALVQVSTGEIKELNLSEAFTENEDRKSLGFKGIPPTGGQSVQIPPTPIKKFMHVQEQ